MIIDGRLYIFCVEPPYIEVLGAQVVARYQGERLSYIEATESCRDSYSSSRFNTVPLYISLQSVGRVSSLSKLNARWLST
jgi:hypothetical protein